MTFSVHGMAVARGIAIGRAVVMGSGRADVAHYFIKPPQIESEIERIRVGRNAVELLRKARAAQYVRKHPNEVCPAKWEEGDDTLNPSLDLVGKI